MLGQHRYYERQVARGWDDYYAGRGEAPGEWVGAGAGALGLSGRVSGDAFSALLAGCNPRDPLLRLRSCGRDPKVAALDLTFSAPKSVSVLAAVGEERLARGLILAHEEAVRAALGYLEDVAVQVRRGHNGERVARGEGLVAAAYRHRMSRALDPQLHTHVVAANMVRGPDGRYTALHGTPLYRAAKTAGFLYQSHLRALVSQRLGLVWGPVREGAAELQAVPERVLVEFSRRRAQMRRAAAEGGIGLGTKAAGEAAALATRERKRYGVQTHTWREEVKARASELGFGARELKKLMRQARTRTGGVQQVDETALGELLAGPEGLTRDANVFDEREVLQAFASAAVQGTEVGRVRVQARRFIARGDVIAVGERELTSAELVACERALIAAAVGRASERCGQLNSDLSEGESRAAPWTLTAAQSAAVRAVTGSGDGVSVIEALAGTGKTYIASVLRGAYEFAGFTVIGAAPTGRAARELTERAGVAARTIDRLLIDLEKRGDTLPAECVVILDEAGMAPTRASARLLQAAQRVGAKVIALGDPGQLSSVSAGGWLGAVARHVGAVRLSEVMRQHDPSERRALGALHDGRPRYYLDWAERSGRVQTFADSRNACQEAVTRWSEEALRVGVEQVVMIARENDTRDRLNTAARELRKALGLLGHENTYGTITLAVGDRVICRRNDTRVDVDNGMRGTVRHLDRDRVVIDTDAGLVRALPVSYVKEHMEHAYALTGHGMQGATVESAFVVAGPGELTAGWSYTALSRARQRTQLLVYGQRSAPPRAEYAPSSQQTRRERAELLACVQARMLEHDSEELAIEMLPAPGRIDDPQLLAARTSLLESHEEQAALGAEPASPPQFTLGRLAELREHCEALRAQLATLPTLQLQRIEELERQIALLTSRRDTASGLQGLVDSPGRRAREDPHDVEAVRLASVRIAIERELERLLEEHAALIRELGDPAQIRAKRDAVERAIATTSREHVDTRDQLAERVVTHPGAWVQNTFGPRPLDLAGQAVWDTGVRAAARYRLEHQIACVGDALGAPPKDRSQSQEWQRAREVMQLSLRTLGRESPPLLSVELDR